MFLLFYTKTVGYKLIYFIKKLTHMTILTILVTIQNTKQNIPNNLVKLIIVFVSDEEKMKERFSELKTWLLFYSYPLTIIEKAFFNAKLQGPAPKKEERVIPFVSTHSNFDSKSISITANSLLSNVKDNRLKKCLTNLK